MRDLEAPRPRRKHAGRGRKRERPFVRVDEWAAEQPADAWTRVEVRPGTKGPLVVETLTRQVQTRDEEGHVGPEEKLLVTRTANEGQPKLDYSLSNASENLPVEQLVRAHAQRFRIEQMFQEGKGEVGLGHYEVRSWVGWHHHMTLAMLALWFLLGERGRMGEKKLSGGDGAADPGNLLAFVA
jgi:hypothetical protein